MNFSLMMNEEFEKNAILRVHNFLELGVTKYVTKGMKNTMIRLCDKRNICSKGKSIIVKEASFLFFCFGQTMQWILLEFFSARGKFKGIITYDRLIDKKY